MTSKRELVFKAIRGEEVERVPVGFWFHFVTLEEKGQGLNNPRIFQKSVEGHRQYVERIHPDFVKIMSDGFFIYPSNVYNPSVASVQELASIESIGENHPWIQQQVEVVQAIRATFTEDIASFYNIFSPISYLKRWFRTETSRGDKEVADLFLENPELFREILDVIAEDIAILTKAIIQDGGADGIYLSTQEIQDERITPDLYQTYIEPSNIKILEAANQAGGINILHICGFQGASNDVTIFKDYPAQVFNWEPTMKQLVCLKVRSYSMAKRFWVVLKMGSRACFMEVQRLNYKRKPNACWLKLGLEESFLERIVRFQMILNWKDWTGFVRLLF